MPRVSVIIPTYNHRDYVLLALESVFAQTFTDYEIIVVNDGSPDGTAELLRPLAENGRVRYIEQPNAGQAAARNRGLAEASGEFIAFLDDDDLWPPDKLAWQVEALDANPDMCLIAGAARVFNGDNPEICIWNDADDELTIAKLCESNPMTSPGQTLIRRHALDAIGGLREDIWGADDWDLYFRLARQGRQFRQKRIALHYRIHGANASHDTLRMVGNALQVLRENLPDHEPAERRLLELAGTSTILRNYRALLVGKCKEAVRRTEWRVAFRCVWMLGQFRRVFAAEPRTIVILLALFLPVRVRNRVRTVEEIRFRG